MIGSGRHSRIPVLLIGLLAVLAPLAAGADSPPPAPADWDRWSENLRYVAHADVKANRIFVERVNAAGRERLWSIAPWLNLHHAVLVSDDGASLVVAPWALKGEGEMRQPVLTFYRQGVKGREWRLGDFFADTSRLSGSVSHWGWFDRAGWSAGRLQVTTIDGRRLSFEGNGEPVE